MAHVTDNVFNIELTGDKMAIFGNFKGTTQPDFRVGKTGARIHGNPSEPITADAGDVWLDSSNTTINLYNGNTWNSVGATLTELNVDNGTLFVDNSNDTVSIGSTSSNEKLFVNGSLRLGTNPAIKYSGAYLDVKHANGTGTVVRIRDNDNNTAPVFKVYGANNESEVFKVQGNVTTTGNLIPSANLTYSLGNATNVWSSIFTDSLTLKDQLTIGSQVFYAQGNNGFSVNEDFDPSNSNTQTAYHFTSGAGRETVAFTLARTGQFTNGFGIYGTSSANKFVMFGEQSNTGWEWRTGVGIRPLDLDGGTLRMSLSNTGALRINDAFTLPTSDGTSGQVLQTDGSGALSFADVSATPAGSNTEIQFNDGGSFGSTDAFTFNKATSTLETGIVRGVIFEPILDYGIITETANMIIDYGAVTDSASKGDFEYLSEIYGPTGDTFTVSSLPSAAQQGQMIYVSDETGGATMAFSDGTNWRRITDRAIVS